MKKQSKITAVLLLLVTAMQLFACGSAESMGSTDTAVDKSTDSTVVSDLTSENSRDKTTDGLPDLDFNGKSIRFSCITDSPDLIGDETGDVVDSAIYNRNRNVEERLNIKVELVEIDTSHMKTVRNAVLAGDDAFDVVAGYQYELLPQVLENLYTDLTNAKYLDFEQPWWANDYMKEVSWGNKRYALMGDISLSMFQSLSCIFVNKRLFNDNFGSVDDFYDDVLDGKWDYDMLNKYVSEVYNDVNSNGITDEGDTVGMRAITGSPTDHIAFTAGFKLSEHDKDGKISLIKDQSKNVRIAEAMYHLFYENRGCFVFAESIDNHVINPFTNGNVLFSVIRTYAADSYRNMADPYGIIPYPKLDDTQDDYRTLIHDGATMFGIPITVNNIDMVCAVVEAMCSESYRIVTPAYYEIALKVKYTHDDISIQLLDKIRNTVCTDFMYANNYAFTGSGSLGTIMRTLMGAKSSDYMSTYESMRGAVEAKLAEMNKNLT